MFFLYDYEEYSKQNGLNIDLFEEFPLYTAKNANELLKVLKEDNYDLKELKRLREKYVPNTLGNCTKRMIDLIRKELQ
jgi:CDP-glycerol glycerophosphotransferase (TagB/SpsB family)